MIHLGDRDTYLSLLARIDNQYHRTVRKSSLSNYKLLYYNSAGNQYDELLQIDQFPYICMMDTVIGYL